MYLLSSYKNSMKYSNIISLISDIITVIRDDRSVSEICSNLPKVTELIKVVMEPLFGLCFWLHLSGYLCMCFYICLCVHGYMCFYLGKYILCHFDIVEVMVALLKTLSSLQTTEVGNIQEILSRYHKMVWYF